MINKAYNINILRLLKLIRAMAGVLIMKVKYFGSIVIALKTYLN